MVTLKLCGRWNYSEAVNHMTDLNQVMLTSVQCTVFGKRYSVTESNIDMWLSTMLTHQYDSFPRFT